MKPLLALKVDVDTFRGTCEGVPRLVRLFSELGVAATFLFSVGPDHTGRALLRVLKRGFLEKVARTSVVSHYGLRTLLYGTLLPGPNIALQCAGELRAVRAAGFEAGLHAYDHVKWQDFARRRDEEWLQREMQKGIDAFTAVFGTRPKLHAAAGWQMNEVALHLEPRLGFEYASDTRGTAPFLPLLSDGNTGCLQIPTTLPTLDELIGLNGMRAENAGAHLFELTREPKPSVHVYTLHAELEGMRLLEVLGMLIEGWKTQGYELVGLREAREALGAAPLPVHNVVMRRVPGRAGYVAVQGPRYVPDAIFVGAAHHASRTTRVA